MVLSLVHHGDAEIDAGIEDVEVELEQEQEEIEQENEAEQVGLADASAYAGDVDVEQSGYLTAADDGVKASSEADANADLDQLALQDNTNAQTAATSVAFTASPAFTGVLCLLLGGTSRRRRDRGRD